MRSTTQASLVGMSNPLDRDVGEISYPPAIPRQKFDSCKTTMTNPFGILERIYSSHALPLTTL